eukprot:3937243-Rhodomonas_salina.2
MLSNVMILSKRVLMPHARECSCLMLASAHASCSRVLMPHARECSDLMLASAQTSCSRARACVAELPSLAVMDAIAGSK